VDFTDHERDLLLAGLFELRITHAEDEEKGAQIEELVRRLGGGATAVFFGAYADSLGAAPVPEYPAGETDDLHRVAGIAHRCSPTVTLRVSTSSTALATRPGSRRRLGRWPRRHTAVVALLFIFGREFVYRARRAPESAGGASELRDASEEVLQRGCSFDGSTLEVIEPLSHRLFGLAKALDQALQISSAGPREFLELGGLYGSSRLEAAARFADGELERRHAVPGHALQDLPPTCELIVEFLGAAL
jgi:hypothetical protein